MFLIMRLLPKPPVRAFAGAIAAALALCVVPTFAAEAANPAVPSPDAAQLVEVIRVPHIGEDGQPDPISGLIRFKVSRAGATTGVRVREVDLAKLKSLGKPVWLDQRWLVAEFDISKSARGAAYLDTYTGRIVRFEAVLAPKRPGVATGEMNNFDVTDSYPNGKEGRVACVTLGSQVLFPLLIGEVPAPGQAHVEAADGQTFLDRILIGLAAWDQWRESQGLGQVEVDQVSEAYNADKSWMSVLLCTAAGPRMALLPLKAKDTADALTSSGVVALTSDVRLNCTIGGDPAADPQSASSRYTTNWASADVAVLERETFTGESDNGRRERVLEVDMKGGELHVRRVAAAAPSAADAGAPTPVPPAAPPPMKVRSAKPF